MEKRKWTIFLVCLTVLFLKTEFSHGERAAQGLDRIILAQSAPDDEDFEDELSFVEEGVPDPLESINRAFFIFNDKLYFWVLKPVTRGYKAVVPEKARLGIGNFFTNLAFPVRFVNCLLQGKVGAASEEFGSFILNSVAGMGGLFDIAGDAGIRRYDEDLDQSLATFGFGPGFYINWPFLGPSTLRGSFGSLGDGYLNPVPYLDSTGTILAVESVKVVNHTSFRIGDYESLKRAALDPYVALKDAYYQNRLKKIKE